MKKLIAIAAIAGLSACGGQAAEEEAPAEEAATEAAAAQFEPLPAGSYVATYEDGTSVPYTTNEVGVYTATVDGEEIKGTYTSEGARSCFDPAGDGEGQGEVCWTAERDAEGNVSATSDEGQKVTIAPAG